MSRKNQVYLLIGLAVILCFAAYYWYTSMGPMAGPTGVLAADTKFEPLDVQEPGLRIDELDKLRKLEYTGSHRNIFLAEPPPPPKPTAQQAAAAAHPFVGPIYRTPPPLNTPAEFFGYASQKSGVKRVAFFASGDDVLVVAEGYRFLNKYRLVHIGK